MGIDLELMKSIFRDDRLHIGLALVKRVIVQDDMTDVAIECEIVPEGRTVIVTDTWESVGDNTGHGDIPDPNDLILIVMADGDPDRAYAIKRLASHEEKLPKQIKDGHFVTKSKPGKKLFLGSDTRVEIGKANADAPAAENLVLGLVFKQLMSDELTQLATLSTTLKTLSQKTSSLLGQVNSLVSALSSFAGSLTIEAAAGAALTAQLTPIVIQLTTIDSAIGTVGSDADGVKTALNNLKSSPVEDKLVLSDTVFTEK
jgi:hypothetical protein